MFAIKKKISNHTAKTLRALRTPTPGKWIVKNTLLFYEIKTFPHIIFDFFLEINGVFRGPDPRPGGGQPQPGSGSKKTASVTPAGVRATIFGWGLTPARFSWGKTPARVRKGHIFFFGVKPRPVGSSRTWPRWPSLDFFFSEGTTLGRS